MGFFSAGAEGTLGAAKGGLKAWVGGLAATVLGLGLLGAIGGGIAFGLAAATFGLPILLPVIGGILACGLAGTIIGGAIAAGPGAGVGGIIAVIGAVFGFGKGIADNQQRGAGQANAQAKELRTERVQLEQDIARLKAQGATMDPNLEAAYLSEQTRMTNMLRQQNNEFINPDATTGHVESLQQQRDAQKALLPRGIG